CAAFGDRALGQIEIRRVSGRSPGHLGALRPGLGTVAGRERHLQENQRQRNDARHRSASRRWWSVAPAQFDVPEETVMPKFGLSLTPSGRVKKPIPGCPVANVESIACALSSPLTYALMTFPTTAAWMTSPLSRSLPRLPAPPLIGSEVKSPEAPFQRTISMPP